MVQICSFPYSAKLHQVRNKTYVFILPLIYLQFQTFLYSYISYWFDSLEHFILVLFPKKKFEDQWLLASDWGFHEQGAAYFNSRGMK